MRPRPWRGENAGFGAQVPRDPHRVGGVAGRLISLIDRGRRARAPLELRPRPLSRSGRTIGLRCHVAPRACPPGGGAYGRCYFSK
ncbi:hypothetical protein chiPu_0023433 [Chiloscyllium punctatum]|uniref:Uncharacterized protein n=1 Tax=Chiloscyllium punctatum TaxID=137246 RepID=A0A401TBA4_CHIPU|nr:hypothetical protein [Chiloscyllium punctatum]